LYVDIIEEFFVALTEELLVAVVVVEGEGEE
jgi:hypothetical protein